MSLNADVRYRSALVAACVKVGLVGCLGSFTGYLYSAVFRTDRKLTIMVFAIFSSSSIVVSSSIYEKLRGLQARELCAVSAILNTLEAGVVILLFRYLDLIALKGSLLIGTAYTLIVVSKINGYRDPQYRNMVYLNFFKDMNPISEQ